MLTNAKDDPKAALKVDTDMGVVRAVAINLMNLTAGSKVRNCLSDLALAGLNDLPSFGGVGEGKADRRAEMGGQPR